MVPNSALTLTRVTVYGKDVLRWAHALRIFGPYMAYHPEHLA